MPQHLDGEEATSWILDPQPIPESMRDTASVHSSPTSPSNPPTAAAYIPPTPRPYYQPPYPTQFQPAAPFGQTPITLGGWISGGWHVYKENGALMSVASLLAIIISSITFGVLSGPLFMGLLGMAYKTMRGERPLIRDLFDWSGRFMQSLLAGVVFLVAHLVLGGAGNNSGFFNIVSLGLVPFLSMLLVFTISLILERGTNAIPSLKHAAKVVFSRDAFMWWVVGLVFTAITFGGVLACGIGALITLPWMISASAVAFRDVFGIDDPNRTNH
jgi:hypothetical protein